MDWDVNSYAKSDEYEMLIYNFPPHFFILILFFLLRTHSDQTVSYVGMGIFACPHWPNTHKTNFYYVSPFETIGYIGKKYLNRAIDEVLSEPLADAPKKLAFSILRVPFFLEPDYDETKPYIESNRERLIKKWGGRRGWEAQKQRHDLKGRGIEAGIPHFNLDRLAANSMASHRLIQHLGKTYGLAVSESIYDRLNK